jgi:hypothetical protein
LSVSSNHALQRESEHPRQYTGVLERERQKLYRIVERYGLRSPQALKQSMLVDQLIVAEMVKKTRPPGQMKRKGRWVRLS